MLPIYSLSILINSLVGLILIIGNEEADTGGFSFSLNNETIRLVAGFIALITGVLKILSPVAGNVPIVGDLFPALTGIAGGLILIFEFYRNKAPDSSALDYMERIAAIIMRNRKLSGIVCLGVSAIHLIFYPVIFL